MKNLLKSFSTLLFAFSLCLFITSCGDDDVCYNCVGFDDGTTSLEDLGTICEGDDDGAGGEVSEDDLEAAVAAYELFGGTCTKQ